MASERQRQKASDMVKTAVPENQPLVIRDDFPTSYNRALRVIEARRTRIALFMMKGYTVTQMADELGCSPSLVSDDIKSIRAQWQETMVENVAEAALVDIARLEFLIAGLIDRSQYDYKAADALLKAIHQKAVILGYEHGVTFDVEQYIRTIAEQNGYDPDKAFEVATKISVTLKR